MRGSGSRARAGGQDGTLLTEEQIREVISAEVVTTVWGLIPKFFGSIKITLTELFDDHYAKIVEAVVVVATTGVVSVGVRGERALQYRDFDSTTYGVRWSSGSDHFDELLIRC